MVCIIVLYHVYLACQNHHIAIWYYNHYMGAKNDVNFTSPNFVQTKSSSRLLFYNNNIAPLIKYTNIPTICMDKECWSSNHCPRQSSALWAPLLSKGGPACCPNGVGEALLSVEIIWLKHLKARTTVVWLYFLLFPYGHFLCLLLLLLFLLYYCHMVVLIIIVITISITR